MSYKRVLIDPATLPDGWSVRTRGLWKTDGALVLVPPERTVTPEEFDALLARFRILLRAYVGDGFDLPPELADDYAASLDVADPLPLESVL